MKYYAIELHTHSKHSDGKFEVSELSERANKFGYDAFFLTDHNSISGCLKVDDKLTNNILMCNGFELTTFYGHMLVLGISKMYNWTKIKIDNIDNCIKELRNGNDKLAIGIAHPFRPGSPICTGCNWSFNLKDWNNIDYIEIFNSTTPQLVFYNEMSYEFWRKKLDEGFRLACATGRDWHNDYDDGNVAVSYIGVEDELNEENIIKAIVMGKSYATLGPRFEYNFLQGETNIDIGDVIIESNISAYVKISNDFIKGLKRHNIIINRLVVINNKEEIFSSAIDYNIKINFDIDVKRGYLIFEVFGIINNGKETRIMVTSPIYIDKG